MVEGARLESVYTSKGYRGFESHSLRHLLQGIGHRLKVFGRHQLLVGKKLPECSHHKQEEVLPGQRLGDIAPQHQVETLPGQASGRDSVVGRPFSMTVMVPFKVLVIAVRILIEPFGRPWDCQTAPS